MGYNKIIGFLLLLFILSNSALAQDSIKVLCFIPNNSSDKSFNYTLKSTDNNDRIIYQFQIKNWEKGFIGFSIDSMKATHDSLRVFYDKGLKYLWGSLKVSVSELKAEKIFVEHNVVSPKGIEKQLQAILSDFENNGYPFAMLQFDSVSIIDNKINAKLVINKNQLYKVDSVIVRGNSKINKKYLSNLIGISEGDIYNESIVREIDSKLKNNLFVRSKSSAIVIFTEKDAKLILDLEKVKSSQFDGLIGFLPNPKTNKIEFSGDVKLHLGNPFNHAEVFDFNWRKLNQDGQELKTSLLYPYILNTVFGVDGNLNILKQDTSYLSVDEKLGVFYSFNSSNYLKLIVNNRRSSVLTSNLLNSSTLGFGDYNATLFGLNLLLNKTDNIYNPRKGKYLDIESMIGNKNTTTYTLVKDSNIQTRSIQVVIGAKLGAYVPISKRFIYKFLIQGASIIDNKLLTNELYRIGGLKTLRGFDEVSIYASDYSILTNEFRFLLEERSYLFLFSDVAWYQKRMGNSKLVDTPIGFGAGISFETKAGNFTLTYALGKQFDNPIEIKNAKIHFGINTTF